LENKIVLTDDGSHTLLSKEFNEHYHSIHGAFNESMHVFLENGFKTIKDKDSIHVLEMGMGSGLNVLLTIREAIMSKTKVYYTAFEQYPISLEESKTLNYIDESEKNLFESIHASSWGNLVELNEYFSLLKIKDDIATLEEKSKYDLVYYDAFAPNCQPELWTIDIFSKIFHAMKIGGVLVTYCAKGYVKRNLKAVGFEVISLPGPPRKREMIKAVKPL
jgi:tRNA U34 5-methylaminomethyl-2-thiouridine-forming methyltransferase MnmC